jgi:hypothetical protein
VSESSNDSFIQFVSASPPASSRSVRILLSCPPDSDDEDDESSDNNDHEEADDWDWDSQDEDDETDGGCVVNIDDFQVGEFFSSYTGTGISNHK